MMKLFLIGITAFFLCLSVGTNGERFAVAEEARSEITVHQTQIGTNVPDWVVATNWLRTHLFILNILDPTKQLDLPVDHDKDWNSLHARILHTDSVDRMEVLRQICCVSKYWRLLSERYMNGFYIYFLEKLLI